MSQIVSGLPTKAAYRFTVVSKPLRAVVYQPAFLQRHLSPPPLPLVDDLPGTLVIQPRNLRSGYTHLAIVSTDPANPVALHLSVHRKYQRFAEHAAPAAEAASPAEGDFVTFFERTIPMLDVSIVASDGSLLLARSPTGSCYICFPAANRWIALPPVPVAPTRGTAAGFHYDVDAGSGTISFIVVLLVRVHRRRILVETFSSEIGAWETKVLGVHGAARCLGPASPGIHAGSCIYWLSPPRHGRILCFDVARGRVSVFREPPQAKGSTRRVGRSLGSAGGRLRLCAFDIRDDEPENAQPHDIEGVHGVWVLDDAGGWQRMHEAVVRDISASFFHVPHGSEVPFDFAGASGSMIIINKNHALLRRDLGSGDKVKLSDLYRHQYGRMAELYLHFDVFPFFK